MKYLAIISVFLISSCSWIQSFNDWADSVMPRQEDFTGGSKTVYRSPADNSSYSQPANPGHVRPDQPNPLAPGGAFNSPQYQDPYANSYGAPQQQPYTPPVNNLPPVTGSGAPGSAYGGTAQGNTESYQRDYWDTNIPVPPGGY